MIILVAEGRNFRAPLLINIDKYETMLFHYNMKRN